MTLFQFYINRTQQKSHFLSPQKKKKKKKLRLVHTILIQVLEYNCRVNGVLGKRVVKVISGVRVNFWANGHLSIPSMRCANQKQRCTSPSKSQLL